MDNLLLKKDLTAEQLAMVQSELEKSQKNKVVMYLLWWFTGFLGGHRFYIGDVGYGIALLFLGWLTLFIWPFLDVFFIGKRLEQKTNELENELINKVIRYTKKSETVY
ncbi:TM2 domain-containing protein [Evansella sp. AB-P1]|uniref:TM2 domain-containing protein n=1 Tax=Evansella sp. AB-P1 TaxID=3037653 RepID=UPI00241E4C4E|nr:TM2 domain-containing protein [Evansella sp. AB-P1]MDG5789338.1 TM2 domain-containing protein [Evansella sp. AB-P1]